MSLKFIQNIIYMTVLCCHIHLKFLCIFAIILSGFIFRWSSIIFESWFKNSYATASFKTFWAVYNEKTLFFCKIFIYELGQINYIYVSKSFILLEFYYLVKMFNFTLPKFPFYGGGNGIVYCCLAVWLYQKQKRNQTLEISDIIWVSEFGYY